MIIIIFLIVCLYLLIQNNKWTPRAIKPNTKKTIILGHRGAPCYERENTVLSFKKAIEFDVDGIEIDVQKSKDSHLILHHDEFLQDKVSKISNNKLFKIQTIQKNNKLNTINDLEPILEEIKILNIEIKAKKIFNNNIEKDVIKFIKKHKIEDKTIVSSFNPIVLFNLKRQNKNIKIGYLFTKEEVHWFIKTYFWANIIQPDIFSVDINYISKNIIKWCRKKKVPMYVFTVNTKKQFQYIKKIGVEGIFTDDPKKLKES